MGLVGYAVWAWLTPERPSNMGLAWSRVRLFMAFLLKGKFNKV
jgi:hypothetical protein